MQTSILLLMFILLIAITSMQTLGSVLHWYSPYLIALGVIIITALILHGPRNDDV
jgi:hypothetical protein